MLFIDKFHSKLKNFHSELENVDWLPLESILTCKKFIVMIK